MSARTLPHDGTISAELHRDCCAGQRRAQSELYTRFAPYALGVMRRFGIAAEDDRELLQDIFVEVFRNIARFDPRKGTFTTWLRNITVQRTIDHQRRGRKLNFITLDSVPEPSHAETDLREVAPDYLRQLIAELPSGYRAVFTLFAVYDYDHATIARLLGISKSSSRSQYARARRALQQALAHHPQSTRHVR